MSTFANTLGRVEKLPAFDGQDGSFEEWAFRARASLAMLHEYADDYMQQQSSWRLCSIRGRSPRRSA